MMLHHPVRLAVASATLAVLAACASAPRVVPERPPMTFEEKMGWILRLEEDRVLEMPRPPAPPPAPAPTGRQQRAAAAVPAPPPHPDLLVLLKDSEGRVRRRAALAVGRTRLPAGVPPLAALMSDADPEVRQMAAFAMGLIGDASAAQALTAALADADPLVQGRAAEALGLIAHKPAADPIAAMMAVHTKAGVLSGIAPDDLENPQRRRSRPSASACTRSSGCQPTTRWLRY